MRVIKIDLPETITNVEVHFFADNHVGDIFSDEKLLKERIEYVKNTPNAFAMLNGDLINNATITSVSDSYSEKYTPDEEIDKAVELFGPIKDKIWSVVPGNHEIRTWKTGGVDITRRVARELGIVDKYSDTGNLLFVRFGNNIKQRKVAYTIYTIHGSGGGKKVGGKFNRLSDLAGIVDADIYVHSHTHMPGAFREAFYRVNMQNSSIAMVDKLFINTAATLDYGGYGETNSFKPASKECPVLTLSGTEKHMKSNV